MKRAGLIGDHVLTNAGGEIAPALVIALAKQGDAVLAIVQTENATVRTWLEPAPASDIIELGEGQYVTRAAAIWPKDPA